VSAIVAGRRRPPRRAPAAAAVAVVGLASMVAGACNSGHQRADEAFALQPAARGGIVKTSATRQGRLVFDHSHHNFHRIDGRYRPFAQLVRGAGFDVVATERQFHRTDPLGFDVLIIANAMPEPGTPDRLTFSEREIDAIENFVIDGGGLLLITDIPPFALGAASLAARFGVRLSGGVVADPQHKNPALPGPPNLLFTRRDGLLGRHPILDGGSPADRVDAVATFSGQAVFAPPDAAVLLRFADSAVHTRIEFSQLVTRFGSEALTTKGRPAPIGGAAQAVALRHGAGRVVVVGEAAAFTAQVAGGDVRFGMNLGGADNARFAVNTVRWLAGMR
jgi:hypothetical protein